MSTMERAVSAVQTKQWLGKRAFDIGCVLLCAPVILPVMILVAIVIKLTSRGRVLYWSDRVGRDNHIFRMPKFRSMRTDTPQLATHLLPAPEQFLTPIGGFLRRTSLDELPQLWSVLRGDLSLVGPRPALFNQEDLVTLRVARGIHLLTPGITGWAQVNGRDDLPIPVKVQFDSEYLERQSLWLDLKILFLTFFKVARAEGVKH